MAEAAERLGAAIRERSGVGPFAPPSEVARALGRQLKFRDLPAGCRGYSVVGSPKILVAPTGYKPQEEFSIAHELVESTIREKMPAWHEDYCDRAAAAILLPKVEFLVSMATNLLEVPAVRRAWPWASWEAIIWRTAELEPRVAGAKWDRFQCIERRSYRKASDVSTAELAAVREAWMHGRGSALVGEVAAFAWWLKGRGQKYRAVSLAVFR